MGYVLYFRKIFHWQKKLSINIGNTYIPYCIVLYYIIYITYYVIKYNTRRH